MWTRFESIADLGNNVVHSTLGNLAVTSLTSDGASGVDFYCSSFALVRNAQNQIDGIVTRAALQTALDTNRYSAKATLANMSGNWVHLRCAYSSKLGKIYSLVRNATTENKLEKNISVKLYEHTATDYLLSRFFRSFTIDSTTTEIHFKGLATLTKRVNLRNFSIFKQFLNSDYKFEY